MKFETKLKNYQHSDIYNEYCGFLDLSLDDYMKIQRRLLLEQMDLWCNCKLGQNILKGQNPKTVEEFRQMVPLTKYSDYADILLNKQEKYLPQKPTVWIETTWLGGTNPIKRAPYTSSMQEVFKNNMIACLILASSKSRNDIKIKSNDSCLYGVASLPYCTGLLPLLIQDELTLNVLPPVEEAKNMSFKERNVEGFKLGMKQGLDIFFALSSVAYYISMALNDASKSKQSHSIKGIKPNMLIKILKAKYTAKKENRTLVPKDLFDMKALITTGTDSRYYKRDLERLWGVKPLEIFAGTEPTCIATENFSRNGLYFFPDACFYEFIPEDEMYKRLEDPKYIPQTYLMDELVENGVYEIVVTVFKGGAFARYLVGDVFRCIEYGCKEDKIQLPRFEYVDRNPDVIDIAGFTRIGQKTIDEVIELSKLSISDYCACKQYKNNRPFMHLIVEMDANSLNVAAVSKQLLKEHLQVYFTYFDNDYKDLQKMLGIDPLKITIVKCGTFKKYEQEYKHHIRKMNPTKHDLQNLFMLEGRCAL